MNIEFTRQELIDLLAGKTIRSHCLDMRMKRDDVEVYHAWVLRYEDDDGPYLSCAAHLMRRPGVDPGPAPRGGKWKRCPGLDRTLIL